MTRKWLIAIGIILVVVVLGLWLYTTYASSEVESEVGEDEPVSTVVSSVLWPPAVA